MSEPYIVRAEVRDRTTGRYSTQTWTRSTHDEIRRLAAVLRMVVGEENPSDAMALPYVVTRIIGVYYRAPDDHEEEI